MAIQEILLDFLEEKKDIKGFINIIDMSADKEKSKTNQKKIVWIFWAFMAIAIFVILNQTGYSDGDDTYFYHYSTTMGFFEYLSWRYQTWVGRMAAEAIVYITFNLGLGFWRVADAVMMVLLPIGILRLGCKTAGYTGYTALLNENQERVDVGTEQHNSGELNVWRNLWKSVRYPVLLASGYLLMSVMTLGYSAVWVNGSIFYTWTFTAGVWAMMPLADLVFDTGAFSNRQLIYALPCSVIAAMSIEQMGAVLLAFEGLSILSLLLQKKRIPVAIWIQTVITFVAFVILFMAPGNDVRVASEIATWMPGYKELSVGKHLFMTIQWMLSSFANEGKAFFIAIWVAGFLLLMKSKKAKVYQILAVVFSVAAILPYAGITFFSEMGIGDIDIEQCLTELPTWQSMITQNRIAFFWWIAAVLFTLVLLWKVTGHSVFISMAFLGGIASEAVLHFSPTIYASGARVYYLTDLMYLFIILWMVMRMDSEKKKNLFIAGAAALGIINFLSQYSIMLLKL